MRDAAAPPGAPFHPDLIIEATNACDKTCPGCYAPNVLVDSSSPAPIPQVRHLSLEQLAEAWPNGERVTLVSVRGGEPTLNPRIGGLLGYLRRKAPRVYLETNGDWIAPGHPLLAVLAGEGCVAKLSLDRMHGSSAREASRRLAALSEAGVSAAVAVTETSLELFDETRRRLLAGFQGEIFWQRKAAALADLILPRLGVISAGGELRRSVTHNLASEPR